MYKTPWQPGYFQQQTWESTAACHASLTHATQALRRGHKTQETTPMQSKHTQILSLMWGKHRCHKPLPFGDEVPSVKTHRKC